MREGEEVQFSVGVVIFVKNEAAMIGRLIDQIMQQVDRKDIFVVDGHSTDGTADIVRQKAVGYLLDDGRGKGAAIRYAIRAVQRDVLVFIDSDGSHQPGEIPALLAPFGHDPHVAMVVGSRFKGGSDELSRSLDEIVRCIGNHLSTLIINVRWRAHLSDTQNGFRAVRRNAALQWGLREDGFAIEQEMTMKCLQKRMKIAEVPSFELSRVYNQSHVVPHRMLPGYIACFLRNIF